MDIRVYAYAALQGLISMGLQLNKRTADVAASRALMEYLRQEMTRRKEEIDKDRTLKSLTFRIVLDHDGNPQCIEYQKNCKYFP